MILTFYETEADLMDYISSESYLAPDTGVCYAFSASSSATDD